MRRPRSRRRKRKERGGLWPGLSRYAEAWRTYVYKVRVCPRAISAFDFASRPTLRGKSSLATSLSLYTPLSTSGRWEDQVAFGEAALAWVLPGTCSSASGCGGALSSLAWPGLPSPVVVFVRPTLFPLEEKELETDYYYYLLREEYTTSKRPYPPPGGGPSQKISFWAEEISLRACPPKSQNDRQALLESLSTALLPLPSPARKTEKSQAEPCFPEGQVRINARAYTNAYTRT